MPPANDTNSLQTRYNATRTESKPLLNYTTLVWDEKHLETVSYNNRNDFVHVSRLVRHSRKRLVM